MELLKTSNNEFAFEVRNGEEDNENGADLDLVRFGARCTEAFDAVPWFSQVWDENLSCVVVAASRYPASEAEILEAWLPSEWRADRP